jgi:hypothetical protein
MRGLMHVISQAAQRALQHCMIFEDTEGVSMSSGCLASWTEVTDVHQRAARKQANYGRVWITLDNTC